MSYDYELQRRYSSQLQHSTDQPHHTQFYSDSPQPASPTSATQDPSASAAHARYSSADLYALDSPTGPASAAGTAASRGSGARLLNASGSGNRNAWGDDSSDEDARGRGGSDDDDDEDDGPGFGGYGREEAEKRASRRTSGAPSALGALSGQQGQGQAKRASRRSLNAPPLIPSFSSQSSLPPQAHLSQHQLPTHHAYSSTSLSTPYGLPYSSLPADYHPSNQSHARLSSAYSLPKLSADASTAAAHTPGVDTVDEPILSKQDWRRGEGIREKHVAEKGKKRERREEVVGGLAGAWYWVRRRWKVVLPLFLLLCVATILLCYFLIPRTPTITFTSTKVPANPFVADTTSGSDPYISSREPTAFSFDTRLTFAIDASASYLPVNFRSFGVRVKLSDTGGTVAHTVWDEGEISVKGRRVTSYEFPLTFHGNYTDDNDRTYQSIRSACAHKYDTIYRPPLNLTVEVTSSIWGVVNPPVRSIGLRGVDCPVEWAQNAS
ncbi:hypothetical protein JCM6882_003214 [Rhodosporidiobolus microsporus]